MSCGRADVSIGAAGIHLAILDQPELSLERSSLRESCIRRALPFRQFARRLPPSYGRRGEARNLAFLVGQRGLQKLQLFAARNDLARRLLLAGQMIEHVLVARQPTDVANHPPFVAGPLHEMVASHRQQQPHELIGLVQFVFTGRGPRKKRASTDWLTSIESNARLRRSSPIRMRTSRRMSGSSVHQFTGRRVVAGADSPQKVEKIGLFTHGIRTGRTCETETISN